MKEAWDYDGLLIDPINSLKKILKDTNGYEFNYSIAEETDNFVHAFFIQKKDNIFKKFSLEINLSSLVISDKMFIGKDLINMELKDHKEFLCKEF